MYKYRILGKNLINNKWLYSLQILETNEIKMMNSYALRSLLETNQCINAVVRSNRIIEIYDVEQAINELVVALDGSNKLFVELIKELNTRPNKKRAYIKIFNKKGVNITLNVYNVLQRNTSITSKGELSVGGSVDANLIDNLIYWLKEQAKIFELPNIIDTNYRLI